MSSTIYLVTSGDYSDYRVDAAFSTSELATEWLKNAPNRSLYQIEERSLDNMSYPPRQMSFINMNLHTGEVTNFSENSGGWTEYKNMLFVRNDGTFFIVNDVTDKEACTKIASDKRAQLIALGRTEQGGYDYDTLVPVERT